MYGLHSSAGPSLRRANQRVFCAFNTWWVYWIHPPRCCRPWFVHTFLQKFCAILVPHAPPGVVPSLLINWYGIARFKYGTVSRITLKNARVIGSCVSLPRAYGPEIVVSVDYPVAAITARVFKRFTFTHQFSRRRSMLAVTGGGWSGRYCCLFW